MELILGGLAVSEQVVCVLPRAFPHKDYSGASLDERIQMVERATAGLPCSVKVTEGGLFIEIARELKPSYPRDPMYFLCGADAADRIVGWDYGFPGFVDEMLREFELLVAPRGIDYVPPAHLRDRIHSLPIRDGYQDVSSTEVRNRIQRGAPWQHLVPPPVIGLAAEIYRREP